METVSEAVELFNQHKYTEALTYIEAAKREGVESFDLYLYQGRILHKMGKYGPAINSFEQAKNFAPSDPRPENEIELIKNILSITNNFYYENPYTDSNLIEKL
jgi:tetratricopeptide (TPR) repeat protein